MKDCSQVILHRRAMPSSPFLHPWVVTGVWVWGFFSAFAAREVFVSSMAIVFNITDENEDSQRETLLKSMNEATSQSGQKIFTISSVLGLIVFFMIALQCMSTFAIAIRESGSLAFALTQLVLFNSLVAYVLTVALVQGFSNGGRMKFLSMILFVTSFGISGTSPSLPAQLHPGGRSEGGCCNWKS